MGKIFHHENYDPSRIQGYDRSGNNKWYLGEYGNYWHDWANNNDTNDANGDWKVDYPYHAGNGVDIHPLKYGAPTCPRNLTGRAGGGYVNLTWEAPVQDGGKEIREYRIYRDGVLIASVPYGRTWYNDTYVVAGREYRYSVTAVNDVGESAPGDFITATPSAYVPEMNLVIVAIVLLILLMVRRI